MISDARGKHVSPGIYTEEKDATYSVKSLGITSLGLVGETLYGPAFENIEINEWSDFIDYFGGTSVEKFRGTDLPKYELPYIAKSYLEKSKRLNVVRVLGLSGYNAGPCWAIGCKYKDVTYPYILLRSRMICDENVDFCSSDGTAETRAMIKSISLGEYKPSYYATYCESNSASSNTSIASTYPRFSIIVDYTEDGKDEGETEGTILYSATYNVSMNPKDSDYIYRILPSSPNEAFPIYVESVYETIEGNDSDITDFSLVLGEDSGVTEFTGSTYENFKSVFRPAQTPWLVSEAYASSIDNTECEENGQCNKISLRKLFKFITISDGSAANYQVKVSIEKINPINGTFNVIVRDYNDTDDNPIILERFLKCTLNQSDESFIGLKIGTADGTYLTKSKYITVLMATDDDLSGSVPCGFMGYPTQTFDFGSGNTIPYVSYIRSVDLTKRAKKQYFGFNTNLTDIDILSYKGKTFNDDNFSDLNKDYLTQGFHMDSIFEYTTPANTYVDGDNGYAFDCVSGQKISSDSIAPRLINNNEILKNTIYKDENLRKFTVCFYGGFDGWDIFDTSRSNTDNYNAINYAVSPTTRFNYASGITFLDLPETAITSDYYAYLAGYRIFANPQDVDINVMATPGIDWHNNKMLTQDVINIIEDQDEGRGGDTLYVMTSPCFKIAQNPSVSYKVVSKTHVDEVTQMFDETEISTSYACTYFPWVLYYDKPNNKYISLPPTKDVVRNIADTDNTSFPWFAPAGYKRGNVDCERADFKTTLSQEDMLYEHRINPIKTFGTDGVKVWGNKTAYDVDSPLNRINVRRLMIRVKKLVTSAAKELIFEQYTDALEKQFRSLVEPILSEVKSNRGIYDFKVLTEITPETRDQHILPAKILIKPTPALEYISISFVVYPENVSFEE